MKNLFIAGTKYKNITGLCDIFNHFGNINKPLSDTQILYIILPCLSYWVENEPVPVDNLMDFLYDR